jgi:predicted ArsR family transcriptional regulator
MAAIAQPRGFSMPDILECLKKYGQRLDVEIAEETGVPLTTVRSRLATLAASGAIITCSITRFDRGRRLDALQCRVSGYMPPLAPGRKSAPKPDA